MEDELTKVIQVDKEANSRFHRLRQAMVAWIEEYREIAEAHREIDNGLTKAIEFWEKRDPEVAAVYREFRDALRDTTAFNVPEVFMKGTAATRSRVSARKRWEGRDKDKLVEKVRAKAMELQGKQSKNSIACSLARKSKEFFGTQISEHTIRDWLKDPK